MTPWLVVKNEADAPAAEILIQGRIGKDWWDGTGMAEKEFTDALNRIPQGRKIIVGINSEGGSVKDGLGMYNALKRRGDSVTSRIDGYALSIASVVALGASKVVSPKSSIWMIHEPWSVAQGNAEDMRKAAEMLDTHGKAIADIYAAETGKTVDEVRTAMKSETWLRGQDAVDFGLADETGEQDVVLNSIDLTPFKNIPKNIFRFGVAAGADSGQSALTKQQKDNTMKKLLAALAEAGLIASADASEDAAVSAFVATFGAIKAEQDNLRTENKTLKERAQASRKAEIEALVQAAVDAKRIAPEVKQKWVDAIIANDGARELLAEIKAPKAQAGMPPVQQQQQASNDNKPEIKGRKAADVWAAQFRN